MKLKRLLLQNKRSIKHIVKWCLIPILLFIFWFTLTLLYVGSTAGITVLMYSHYMNETISWNTRELLAREKIRGEFIARDNNLGIVAVRFNTFFRINEDIVRFRIKENRNKDWFYENDYTTPQFQPNQLFTFGFPIIEDSREKKYTFEIESLQGEKYDAVAVSPIEPVYVTKYQYSRKRILSDNKYMISYLKNKILNINDNNYAVLYLRNKISNIITNKDSLSASIAYFIPLFLYLIWLLFFDKYLYDKLYLIFVPLSVMVIASVADVLRNDPVVIGITLFWLSVSVVYRLSSNISIVFALFFLILSAILMYSGFDTISKNFAVWTLMLLAIGLSQAILELKSKTKLISLPEFWKKINIKIK